MSAPAYEAGIRPSRIEFVRESTAGTTPADPSWQLHSDTVSAFETAITPQTVARNGLGDPDTAASHPSVEQNELTITYDLNHWLVDGSGDAQDAVYDAFARDSDNRLPNTQTVVARMEQSDLESSNTVNGSSSYDTRQYFVGKGGRLNEATISLSPSDTAVWQVEVTYLFEKARRYQIDQPDSSTTLDVVSSDSNDTMDITIEDEGAGTSETISLSGTTTETTTSSFGDIDALELASEPAGTVTVSISSGDALAELHGANDYDHDVGDLGVPALGSGSHASAIGSSLEVAFDGDTIERPGGTALAENVGTLEMSVSNNVEATARATSPLPTLSAGKREIEIAATIWGEAERIRYVDDMLQTSANDYVWTPASGNSLTVGNIKALEVGATEEAQQGRLEIDVTLGQQESVTIA